MGQLVPGLPRAIRVARSSPKGDDRKPYQASSFKNSSRRFMTSRKVCVMFLDIRDFTANARSRQPKQVVEFLNATFGFMIESIDRQGGFVNKFLGDGFMT